MTSTITATRTHARTLSRAAHPSSARPVRAARVAEPAGLAEWRLNLHENPPSAPPTASAIRAVLAGVREGASLAETAQRARLSQARTLDVVVGVGSRISQMNKYGPRAAVTASLGEAAEYGITEAGVYLDADSELVVVLADGWGAEESHGRQVGRSYAAVLLAFESDTYLDDDRPMTRWVASLSSEVEVGYGHYAHLRSVASGQLVTFAGLSSDPDVQNAYLTAFDRVAAWIGEASAAVTRLCRSDMPAGDVDSLLRVCFWMVPDARAIKRAADAALAGHPAGAGQLRLQLSALRAQVARQPALFFPRTLADLTTRQYRAVLALHGFHPADIADAARPDGDSAPLTQMIADIAARVAAGESLAAAADAITAADAANASDAVAYVGRHRAPESDADVALAA